MKNLLTLRAIVAIGLLLSPLLLTAQTDSIPAKKKIRNIAWFTPCGANQINGLAVGLQAMPIKSGRLEINGLNADAGVGGMLFTPYALFLSFPFSKDVYADFDFDDSTGTIIKGISISMGGEFDVSVTGINIAGGITVGNSLNGISITGIYTKTYRFNGLCISGLHNIAMKGAGIQIGLFNYCKDLKGLQIGLWNKSGKRGLPFINWGT